MKGSEATVIGGFGALGGAIRSGVERAKRFFGLGKKEKKADTRRPVVKSREELPAPPPPTPKVVFPDGWLLLLPRKIDGLVRDSNGNLYAKYPDGSLRRCTIRGGRKKYSKRKTRRETAANFRGQVYRVK